MTAQQIQKSSVSAALNALEAIKEDVNRIGKVGGNLNDKIKARLQVIETTLLHFEGVEGMQKTISQQSQLVQKVYNDMQRAIERLLPEAANGGENNNDIPPTKGE